jgi:general secretion pathway protein F
LETLLRAGMGPVEAIETLAAGDGATSDSGDVRSVVHRQLLGGLHQGLALSHAMRQTGAFPEVLLAGVTASERTSTLGAALTDYLRYDELLQRLRRQMVSAALYPALVVALGALIAGFLLLFVMPRFSRMYSSFAGSLSAPTEFVLVTSRLLLDHGWIAGLAFAGVAAAAGIAWRRGVLAARIVPMLEAMKLLRRPLDHLRRAQLYQAMGMLVRGGYTVDEALHVAAGMPLGMRLTAQIEQAREAASRGKAISASMAGAGLADIVAQRLISVGERGGGFAPILQTIADRHASEFTTFVERTTRLLEPLLLLAVALLVGSLVVLMYLPIFDIAGGLGAVR